MLTRLKNKSKRVLAIIALIIITAASALALFGCFDKNGDGNSEYTVTFHAGNGYFTDDEHGSRERTVTVKSGDTVAAPDVRFPDHVLVGWSENSERNESPWKFDSDTVTANIHLYAHYTGILPELILSVDGATVNAADRSILMIVPPDTTSVSLDGKIVCSDGAVWALYDAHSYDTALPNTVTDLEGGDNRYTLRVSKPDGDGAADYSLNIHRKHLITVTYGYSGAGSPYSETTMSAEEYTVDYRGAVGGGYEPNGWKYQGEPVASLTPMHDITLEPTLKARSFDVALDADGGDISANSVTAVYGEPFAFPVPQKHGYDFTGWWLDGNQSRISDGDGKGTWHIDSDITLHAGYTARLFGISARSADEDRGYVSAAGHIGGSANEGYSQFYQNNITFTAHPSVNCIFTGWYNEQDVRVATSKVFTFTVQGETRLTAKFADSPVTVTSEIGNVQFSNYLSYGEQYTAKPRYSTVIGHTFDGWYKNGTEKVSSQPEYTFVLPVDCPAVTFTAKWIKDSRLDAFEVNASDTFCKIVRLIDKTATSVTVPDLVTGVETNAFRNCENLTAFEWPQQITEIPESAFSGCRLLRNIALPSTLKEIGDRAFENCGLTSITLPQSVTKVHERAFGGCVKLVEMRNDSSLSIAAGYGCAVNTLNVYKTGSGASKLTAVGDYLFYINGSDRRVVDYTGSGSSLDLPQSCNGYPYKVHACAFAYKKGITSVSVPQKVTAIGDKAFYGLHSVTSLAYAVANFDFVNGSNIFTGFEDEDGVAVTFASTVLKIPDYMFNSDINGDPVSSTVRSNPVKVASIAFESAGACASVGSYAFFDNDGLTSLTLPDSVTSVGDYAFCKCENLNGTLTLSQNETSVGSYAFYLCHRVDSIAGKLKNVGDYAFYKCAELSGTLPLSSASGGVNGGSLIGSYAFCQCEGLEKITGVFDNIGAYAFYMCSGLTGKLVIGDKTSSIGSYAFAECANITELSIGKNVYYINDRAFNNCANIGAVNFDAVGNTLNPNYRIDSCAFFGLGAETDGVTVTFGSSVKIVPVGLFGKSSAVGAYGDLKIKRIVFDANCACEKISQEAFDGLKELISVNIPKNVTAIGKYAFRNCTSLKDIYYNAENCNTFGENNGVFSFDGEAQTVKYDIRIGGDVVKLPAYMFMPYAPDSGKKLLINSLDLTQAVKLQTIGINAFRNALSVRGAPCYIDLPSSVVTIDEGAFYGCDEIIRVSLGANVQNIRANAFAGCIRLAEIVNGSALPLAIGSDEYGGIAEGATAIEAHTKLVEIGDFTFYEGESERLLVRYKGESNSVYLPDGDPYIINKYVFYGYDITGVAFRTYHLSNSGTVTETTPTAVGIGDYAFCNTAVKTIVLSESIEQIGIYAFSGCANLTACVISSNVKNIGEYAFSRTDISKIHFYAINCNDASGPVFTETPNFDLKISAYVTRIPGVMFSHSRVRRVYGPATALRTIGSRAFEYTDKILSADILSAVQEIGDNAFAYSAIESVTLSEGLQKLGEGVFRHTPNLTNVVLPDSATQLGDYLFEYSSVTSVALPSELSVIPEGMFQNTARLTSIDIPDTVSSIGDFAFRSSAVTSAVIPYGVKVVGEGVFKSSALSSVTLHNGIVRIGERAFEGCKLTDVTIPNSVQTIELYAFSDIGTLKTLTIGRGVVSIGVGAFNGCTGLDRLRFNAAAMEDLPLGVNSPFADIGKLTADGTELIFCADMRKVPDKLFFLPDSVANGSKFSSISFENNSACTAIGERAFSGIKSVGSLEIPENVTAVGDKAFYNCAAKDIYFNAVSCGDFGSANEIFTVTGTAAAFATLHIGKNVSAVPAYLLNSDTSRIGAIVFDRASACAAIGGHAFSKSKIEEIAFPDSVTSIGEYALADCTLLASVTLPSALQTISYGLLNMSEESGALTNITLPETITSIGDHAFCNNSLTTVTIPSAVTSIGDHAFYNNKLTEITIPNKVSGIGSHAFGKCLSLASVLFAAGSRCTYVGSYAFYALPLLQSITFPSDLTTIGDHAFAECATLQSITFRNSNYMHIGSHAFYALPKLQSVRLSIVDTIEDHAFAECGSLETVTFNSACKNIGDHAFYALPKLQMLTLPKQVNTVGQYAFAECGSLTTVEFKHGASDNIESIGDHAFYNCKSLSSVTLPSKLKAVPDSMFALSSPNNAVTLSVNMSALTTLNEIGGCAFMNKRMNSAFIPDTVHKIGSYAFEGTSLQSVTFARTVGWKAGEKSLNTADLNAEGLCNKYKNVEWTNNA